MEAYFVIFVPVHKDILKTELHLRRSADLLPGKPT